MMDKFENIQAGDTVYIETTVGGWSSVKKRFFLPEKVIRVTKAQFVIVGKFKEQFIRKKDGCFIKDKYTYAYKLFEKIVGGVVTDQTEEYKEYKIKLNITSDIEKILARPTKIKPDNYTLEELDNILKKLEDLKRLLK